MGLSGGENVCFLANEKRGSLSIPCFQHHEVQKQRSRKGTSPLDVVVFANCRDGANVCWCADVHCLKPLHSVKMRGVGEGLVLHTSTLW